MGRQYNYYITPEEDKDFMKYLSDNGYIILDEQQEYNDEKKEYICTWKTVQLYDASGKYNKDVSSLRKTYIYKEEWGKLVNNKTASEVIFKSPVIEHVHCKINVERNELTRGRLYLCTYCKELIPSFDIVYKEYQKLVRIIKKYITYKEYPFEDARYGGGTFSQKAVDLTLTL